MKENVLTAKTRPKQNFALKAFLLGMAMAAVFVLPNTIIYKGVYLFYADFNMQVVPFYQHMVRAVHEGNVGWDWYTDLGSSFVGTYSFYNLGSPFFWIMAMFPAAAVPYIIGPLQILKFGVSALTAYMFMSRYVKNKNNAVLGAILYAFSGAAMYDIIFHFIDIMALFPLTLWALDRYVHEDKRGWFAFTVALCAVTNYYLFTGVAVFLLIYWVVRMVTGSYKLDARHSFYLLIEAILGTGVAAAILLPTVYHVVGNSRLSASDMSGWGLWAYKTGYEYLNVLLAFIMPPEFPETEIFIGGYVHKWVSNTAYLPLFGTAGMFAVMLNKHRNKWIRVLYGVCAVFLFVPVLNSSFQLFTNYNYMRWLFMLLIVMALGTVMALEDPSTKWKKAIALDLTVTAAAVIIMGFTPVKTMIEDKQTTVFGIYASSAEFWELSCVALANIALLCLFIHLYKKNTDKCRRYASMVLVCSIIGTLASTFVPNARIGYNSINPQKNGLLNADVSTTGITDFDDWRSDVITQFNWSQYKADKDSLPENMNAKSFTESDSKFYDQLAKEKDKDLGIYEIDNATIYWNIPGFGHFHSTVNSSIGDFYYGLGVERNTLSNPSQAFYALRSFLSVKYMFGITDSILSFTESNDEPTYPGWKYVNSWGKYDIYENEYVLPHGMTFDRYMSAADFQKVPEEYRHLVLVNTLVTDSIDNLFEFAAAGMEQVHENDFDFTQEEYIKSCEDRIASGVSSFTKDKKGFEATITTGDKEEYVLFNIPYDSGWKAAVNGVKTKVELADYGFMIVKVPANMESVIRFDYHTQGTTYGAFITAVCLIMLFIYLAVVKVRTAADAEEEQKAIEERKNRRADEKTDSAENDDDDLDGLTVFDIVKQTEENTMMQVYKRVPVVLERGFGAVGFDINDKKYIDFTSGIGVNALGYADGRWAEAVEKQIYTVQHTSNLYYNTTQISLAEMLCAKTGFSRVFFANSGAEANECAIKIARKYGSDKFGEKHTHIITLENSFHGRTITTLSATGQDVFHKHFTPFTEGFSFAKANDMDSIRSCTTEDTCAVMIELIQGEGGVNPLDKKFVTDLAAYCKEKGLLLIVDEIQTGVGRTGKLYCYENFGIQPDVLTSAKALSGGLPLSACMCTEELKDVLTAGTNGTTFGGNPIACAGALKILEIVGNEDFLAEVRAKGEYMRQRIKKMKGVKDVRGMGMMIGIVLDRDNAGQVLGKCAENGLLVLTAKNLIRLLPPLNIEYEDINEGLDILEKCINEE